MKRIAGLRAGAVALLLALASQWAQSVRAGDCNGNGVEDIEDTVAGVSADCDGNAVPDECEQALFRFGLRDAPVTLEGPAAGVVTADLDGDGDLDVAVGLEPEPGAARVIVLRNDGDGVLEMTANLAAGSLDALDGADLDGDRDVDLVSGGGRSITVFENDGSGAFTRRSIDGVGELLFDLALVDLTRDGLPEVAVTDNARDELILLPNDGAGGFLEPRRVGVGQKPTGVAGGDFDGDGHVDLAVASWTGGAVSILSGDGAGGLERRLADGAVDRNPRHVEAGDLDGDGRDDLAVASTSSITVLLGREGGLAEPARFELRTRSLAIGDLDSDGDLDLAVGDARGATVAVLDNAGDGAFRARYDFGVGATPIASATGDLDGDGDVDLVVATGRPDALAILRNGGRSRLLETTSARYGFGQPPHGADAADMDGDGDIDVLTANGFQASITLMRNDGAGAFRLDRHIGNLGYLNTIAAGDLDNDDDRDVVTADFRSNRIFVLLNNGDGTLGEPAVYRSGQAPFFVTTADLDGDGFRDVISADEGSRTVTVFRNRGDGTLAIGESIPAQGRAWCVAPTDLDRDGDLDLAVANQTPGSVLLLENIGDARYDAAAAVSIRVPGASYVAAADLDGDGDVDLAVSTWTRRRVAVLENTGRGTFRTPVEYDIGRTAYSLEIADMDGDGFLDLVTSDRDDNSVTVVLNQGDGTFFRGSHLPTGGEPRFSMTGDLDGDGVVDVVAANHDTWDLTVHLNVLPAPFDGNFVERICTVEEMRKVSVVPVRAGRVELAGKYIAPVAGIAGAPIDRPLYQNVRRFPLHEEFLRQVFPEVRFQSAEEYDRLVGRRATRRYWVGSILRLRTEIGIVHAFTAFADTGNSLAEALSLDEVREIHDALSASFELRPFAYLPDTNAARREARGWENPGFPVLLDDEIVVTPPALEFEAYTQAVWYGRVLLLERDAFDAANEIGRFSFQDIVVLSFAPRDIEGVVGGVITSETQVPLSHLSVRTARRGIPNAFVRDALERFLPFEGELVRLEVREDGFDVTPATPAEAEAFWSANRPRLGTTPQVDRVHRSLDDLLEIDVGGGGVPPEARYGGKAVNFARLQQLLEGGPFERYRESGFAIPVVHSLEFMEENTIPSAVDPARTVTYREYVEEIDADPELQTSPARRFAALEALRDHAEEHGRVSRSLVLRAVAKIAEVFGSTTTTVRFRSSSNVEDLLDFNGAGLYESTSACAADEVDSDDAGPSRCDRLRRDERGVERALKRVWISLWTFRAYEERAFFQIPQRSAAMGVLVTRAFPDERANGVAFTGNPLDPVDRRYMVVVQRGETSVVSPPPDVVAERDFIGVLAGQTVLRARDQGSSLLPEGEHVLSDEELDELGALLHHVAERFPVELEGHQPDEVILDFEFKIERDGSLAVKQVRPFLHSAPFPPSPEFELAVPPGAGACGIFSDELVGRSLRQEYESKSAIRFLPGAIALPTRGNLLEVDLVEELVFGPQRETATPAGPGFVFSRRRRGAGDTTEYSFRFEQEFALADGRSLRLELGEGLDFTAIAEEPVERSITLDDGFLRADDTALLASVDGEPMTSYSSCSQDHLPLWSIEAELSDGATVSLRQRFIPFEELNGPDTGPASLVWARVELPGATQTVADYWRLIYRARNHNLTVRWGVVLDPAVELEGLERPIAVVELSAPDSTLDGTPISPASARYLDAEFEPLAELEVSAYTEERLPDEPQPLFRRGDSDGDGRVGLTDAVKTLDALFRGGDPPPCPDAADADDDGALRIADPIFTLNYLFLGGRAPPEPGADGCGVDPTGDELGCPGEGC